MKKKSKTFWRQSIEKYKKTEDYRCQCRRNLESLPRPKNNTHLKQLKKQAKKTTIQLWDVRFVLKTIYLPGMIADLNRDQKIYDLLNRNNRKPPQE